MSRWKRQHLKSPWSLTVSSASRSHRSCVSHQGILSTMSLSFQDSQASHSKDIIWPWKFKVKGNTVSAASSWLISLVFNIMASYRLPSHSIPWQSGIPFLRYNLALRIQGQNSRSNGPQSAWHPVDSFCFCFTSIGPTTFQLCTSFMLCCLLLWLNQHFIYTQNCLDILSQQWKYIYIYGIIRSTNSIINQNDQQSIGSIIHILGVMICTISIIVLW